MILKEFSDFLKTNEQKPSVSLLFVWLKQKIETPAKSNVDKILQKELIHHEIRFCKNREKMAG